MSDEITRREKLAREDEAARQRGETTRPDRIAAEHGPATSLDGSTAQVVGDALQRDLPLDAPPTRPSAHGLGKLDTGGMTKIDAPAGQASILDSVEPATAPQRCGSGARSDAGTRQACEVLTTKR